MIEEYLTPDILATYERYKPFKHMNSDITDMEFNEDDLVLRGVTELDDQGFWVYLGQWNKHTNKPEGRGVAVFKNKALYEGMWKNGKENGKGKVSQQTIKL